MPIQINNSFQKPLTSFLLAGCLTAIINARHHLANSNDLRPKRLFRNVWSNFQKGVQRFWPKKVRERFRNERETSNFRWWKRAWQLARDTHCVLSWFIECVWIWFIVCVCESDCDFVINTIDSIGRNKTHHCHRAHVRLVRCAACACCAVSGA